MYTVPPTAGSPSFPTLNQSGVTYLLPPVKYPDQLTSLEVVAITRFVRECMEDRAGHPGLNRDKYIDSKTRRTIRFKLEEAKLIPLGSDE